MENISADNEGRRGRGGAVSSAALVQSVSPEHRTHRKLLVVDGPNRIHGRSPALLTPGPETQREGSLARLPLQNRRPAVAQMQAALATTG